MRASASRTRTSADPDAALATIVDRYRAIDRACEAVVIVESDYTDIAGPTELTFNARVTANLGAPVLLVVSGFGRSPDDVVQVADIATAEIAQSHATTVGVLANRCDADQLDAVLERLAELGRPVWALPEIPLLSAPIVGDLMTALDGKLLLGDEFLLGREAEHMLVGGMNTEHVLERLRDGQLCIVAGDRPDVLLALHVTARDGGYTSGHRAQRRVPPVGAVEELVQGLGHRLPIVRPTHDSYWTARIVASTRGCSGWRTQRKKDTALAVFERYIDAEALLRDLDVPRSDVVTPLMFESMLVGALLGAADIVAARGRWHEPRAASRVDPAGPPGCGRDPAGRPGHGAEPGRQARPPARRRPGRRPHASDLLKPFAAEYAGLRPQGRHRRRARGSSRTCPTSAR